MTTNQVEHVDAFPTLSPRERDILRPLAMQETFCDGQHVFHAGDADIDLFVVEHGSIEIRNPLDGSRVVAIHRDGDFSGDIDLLTSRPVIVEGIAMGETILLRVPNNQIRVILNRIPSLGEKLLIAFTRRRELLTQSGKSGLQVIGYGVCKDTNLVREFLHKNFVPFDWVDSAQSSGKELLASIGSPKKTPVVICNNNQVLVAPTIRELAQCAKVWKPCKSESVDLAIVGAGPAGITTAVYAASEGLSTLLLDRLGPGGQAAGSSRIENFIGFPSGLSGADLAMRGIIQMLKFGARIVAPADVQSIQPSGEVDSPMQVTVNDGAVIEAKVVLVATGVRWRKLDVENASQYEGAGLHYVCTSVEANLYDNSDVAVVGGGNSAGQAAMFLAECCRSRTVHLLVRNQLGPGMSEYLSNRIRATANVQVHEQSEIAQLEGTRGLESISIRVNGIESLSTIPCRAVFVFIGADPAASSLPSNIARDNLGYVLTGVDAIRSNQWPLTSRDPCPLETTMPRVLAAGDIRSGSTKRVGFAVGDGSLAVTCAHRLISLYS